MEPVKRLNMSVAVCDFLLYCKCGARVFVNANGANTPGWVGLQEDVPVECPECHLCMVVRFTVLRRMVGKIKKSEVA